MEETIFDRIVRREIPADIVFEDEWVLAFRDINPQAPTHVLVIPKNRLVSVSEFNQVPVEQVGRYMQGVSRVAEHLGLEPGGYRVVFNHGKHGQQSVPYLHAHILGGKQLSWPPG